MQAAFITAFGPPEAIEVGELPRPEPKEGEVLVKVGAAGLNPVDLGLRSGAIQMGQPMPFIVGADLAGTVERLGPGAHRYKVGDRVWGSNQQFFGRQGVTSEYAAVHEDWLYPTPESLSDREAAAMALTAITAHLGLFEFGKLAEGETIYVPGGAGGVGSMVIQMARASGARVATSGGRAESLDIARSLGADLVLNYKTDDIPARLREFAPEGYDLWFETQREPDLEISIPLLRPRGRMILMAGRTAKPIFPLGAFYTRNCSILGFAMFNSPPDEQRKSAVDINRWASSGELRIHIGRSFPLSETARAHKFLEENTMGKAGQLAGKIVIEVGS